MTKLEQVVALLDSNKCDGSLTADKSHEQIQEQDASQMGTTRVLAKCDAERKKGEEGLFLSEAGSPDPVPSSPHSGPRDSLTKMSGNFLDALNCGQVRLADRRKDGPTDSQRIKQALWVLREERQQREKREVGGESVLRHSGT